MKKKYELEKTLKRRVRTKILDPLRTKGYLWYYMPVQVGIGQTGIPDFVICLFGRFLALETKAPGSGRSATGLQQKNLDDIAKAGGHALCSESYDEIYTWISSILTRNPTYKTL